MIEEMLEATDEAATDKVKAVKDKKDKVKDKDKDPDPGCCTPPDTDPGPIGG